MKVQLNGMPALDPWLLTRPTFDVGIVRREFEVIRNDKLEANNRRAAVRRAEELDLFLRTRNHHPRPWHTCRGLFSLPHSLPIDKSPHQSPHVVMPSHHITCILMKKGKHATTWRCIHRRNMKERRMSETHVSTEGHHEPGLYEICLKGHLDARCG
jgi:hypothetical protein